MNCPKCNHKTQVIDKRPTENGTRRRRECLKCKYRFSTRETLYEKEKRIPSVKRKPKQEKVITDSPEKENLINLFKKQQTKKGF